MSHKGKAKRFDTRSGGGGCEPRVRGWVAWDFECKLKNFEGFFPSFFVHSFSPVFDCQSVGLVLNVDETEAKERNGII